MKRVKLITSFSLVLILSNSICGQEAKKEWWPKTINQQLDHASSNATQLRDALLNAPPEHRDALVFVVANLPRRDLKSVTAKRLLDNIRLAYEARNTVPWGKKIPQEIFFNDVLPDFNIDETRESWRADFFKMCMPMIADCKTPAEAAQRLNERLFKEIKVKYSTKRKKANQSPSESIEQGLASCTGLSILLTDACRSVCVPSRLAGIPRWPNKRGNHTWVEVWDDGWHFTGAAEPNGKGLNHTWFQGDAALADKTKRMNSIYAVSFKKTDTTFPMVWSRGQGNEVYAVNVTDRYAKKGTRPEDKVQTMIRLWNRDKSERVITDVVVVCESGRCEKMTGKTKGGTADMNDMLEFQLPKNTRYRLHVGTGDEAKVFDFETQNNPQQLVEFILK